MVETGVTAGLKEYLEGIAPKNHSKIHLLVYSKMQS